MKPIGIELRLGGEREVESGLRRVGGAMDSVGTAASGLARAVGGVAGAFAGVVSIREFVQAADAVTSLQNRLKLATGSAQAAGTAYNELFLIAQRSRTGFIELGQTFASVSTSAADLGISQQRLLKVTEAIGNAVTISGSSAQAANAALVQLGQGLASGTLRGEELNSVMEQLPRLAKALADGLGVTRGELRALGQQGAITAEQVIGALESQAAALRNEVKGATMTVGQAFTQLKNEAVLSVGAIDQATGSTALLAQTISDVSGAIGELRNTEAFMDALTLVGQTVTVLFNDVAFVLKGIGREIGGIAAQAAAVARLDFSGAAAIRAAMVSDAKAARAELDAREVKTLKPRTTVQADPNDPRNAYNNFTSRSQSFANAPREQAAAEKELLAIRQKLYGVDKDYIPMLEKLNQQYQSGRLTLAEYTGLVERLANANFKKPSAGQKEQGGNPYAAQQDAAKAWAKTMMDAEKGVVDLEEKTQGLNQAQGVLLEYISSPAYAANSEEMRQAALARLYVWDAAIKNADGIKAEKEAMEQASKAMAAWFDVRARDADALKSQVQARREEVDAMGLSADAVARLSAAKYEQAAAEQEAYAAALKSAKLYAGEYAQAYDAAAQDALDQAKRLRELGTLDIAKGQKQAALDAETEWKRTADTINQSLTDALMRGFESGKDFAKNMRDTVVNMFKTMVLRPVISAVLSPISGALGGVLGGGAGGAGSNPIGMASNAYSMYNAGSQAWTLGSQYMAGTMSGANVLGTAYANATGGGIDALLETNGAYGTAPAGAGWMGQIGTAGGVFAAITGLAAAFGAFRKEVSVGGGLSGTFGAGDITGYDLRRESGYLFGGPDYTMVNPAQKIAELEAMRGKGTYLGGGWAGVEGALEQEIERLKVTYKDMIANQGAQSKALQTAYEALRSSAGDMADSLGLGSDAVRAFTTTVGTDVIHNDTGGIGIKLDGLKPEEVQAKIQAALATASNELAQQVIGSWKTVTETVRNFTYEGLASDDGIRLAEAAPTVTEKSVYVASEFAKDGEKAIDTLTRLSTSLSTVNDIWANLGNTVYEASLAGADAASKMADAFGGLEAMAASTGAYFENFYSSEEQRAAVERQLNEALGKMNLTLPDIDATDARAQYRALAEAQDRNTEAGREAYVTLLQHSGAFASVTQAAGRAMDAAGFDRKDRLAAQRAQEKQAAEALQKQIEAYAEGAEQFNVLRDALFKAGDAAGLLAAATERAFADPRGTAPKWGANSTAASFNYEYGLQQAAMRQSLSNELSASALRVANVGGALGGLSVSSMMGQDDPVIRAVYIGMRDAMVQAAGDAGFAVRDAVDGAALYAAQAQVRAQFSATGPGLASVYAARESYGLASSNTDVKVYEDAQRKLNGALSSGAIGADQFARALQALNDTLPQAAALSGDFDAQAARAAAALYELAQTGLRSIGYYFGQLNAMALELAKMEEPINATIASIGRLNSFETAFGVSADAAGATGLSSLQIDRAQLIAEAAGIASAAMTTADAAAAAAKLAQSPAFAELGAKGIRDAALLLDGVGQYNAEGFERAFIRISDALAKGGVTEDQYKALFGTALDMFKGVPEETRTLIDSMTRLRDAMSGFADGLLIDEQRTTLSAGATLAEMQRQYAPAFAGAATGDNDAIGKYQQLANTLLDKELYSTQAEYNAAFGSVYGDARQLEAIGINTMANAQGNEMVSELKDMNAKLNKRVEDLEKNLLAALAQIAKNTSDTSRGIEQQIVMAEDTP